MGNDIGQTGTAVGSPDLTALDAWNKTEGCGNPGLTGPTAESAEDQRIGNSEEEDGAIKGNTEKENEELKSWVQKLDDIMANSGLQVVQESDWVYEPTGIGD